VQPQQPEITDAIVAEHGLTPEEFGLAVQILGRRPNLLQLG
jgi:hypothetical protein